MDEMCVTYLQIYPAPNKINWVTCMSKFNDNKLSKWLNNGIQSGYINGDKIDNLDLSIIKSLKFDVNNPYLIKDYNNLWRYNEIEQFCTNDLQNSILDLKNNELITAKMPLDGWKTNNNDNDENVECFNAEITKIEITS